MVPNIRAAAAAAPRLPLSEVEPNPSRGIAGPEKPRVNFLRTPPSQAQKTPALAALERTPGWKALTPEVRRALTALLSGTSNPRSKRAAPVALRQPSRPGWAMAADVISPSRYATASPVEDVAEAISTYFMTRGTKAFDEYRAMMPNRFAVLDEMLSRPAAKAA